jgi:hypothetical protein
LTVWHFNSAIFMLRVLVVIYCDSLYSVAVLGYLGLGLGAMVVVRRRRDGEAR